MGASMSDKYYILMLKGTADMKIKILDTLMKAIGPKVSLMERGKKFIKMEMPTKDKSCMGKSLDQEFIDFLMEEYTKVAFITTKAMAEGKLAMQKTVSMKVNGDWESFMGRDSSDGRMEKPMMGNIKMANVMDAGSIFSRTVVGMKEVGKTEYNLAMEFSTKAMMISMANGLRASCSAD